MAYNKSGRLLWLADVCRAAGFDVQEVEGWKTRGNGDFTEVRGVVAHHTANPNPADYSSLNIITYGRQDLKGPLSQLGLGRSGKVYVIAAGVAWHAGTGSYSWLPTNNANWYSIGIEAESAGTYDDWTPAQRTAYPKLVAALLAALGLPGDRIVGHKEYSDAGKIDPAFWDMNQFRATVKSLIAGGSTPGDDDMDMNTPVTFSTNIKGYFDATGGPGFGDVMASNFPQGGNAPYGTVTSWDSMSSRAAYLKSIEVEKKLDALTALVQKLLAK